MTEQINSVPKRRFKKFYNTDGWEQRKWEETVNISTNMVDPKTGIYDELPHIGPGNIESFTGRILDNVLKVKNSNLISGKFHFYKGDIIYGKINPQLGKYALAPYDGLSSADSYVLKTKNGMAQNFLYTVLQTKDFYKYSVSVSSRTGMPKINREELNLYIYKAPTQEEQTKIGKFIVELEHLITLHQRKLEKMKALKSAYLTEMFPADGETVPKRRFVGLTDNWEQRKLESIYGKIRNAFVGTATPYYVEAGHFYLESNNVKYGQINRNTEIFINDEFYEKQKDNWLHTGDLVMVQSGHVGHTAVIPEELDNTAAHALIMFSNYREKTDPYFLNYQFQTNKSKKKLEEITTGNTIKHILASEMKKFFVDIPKYEEQQAIGSFFKSMDNLITLHQRKLEKLKNTKKAYLNEMFV